MTDRWAQAVAELMGKGQLDMSRWQELSVVLKSDQTCVEGGRLAVTQGGKLWTYSSPVTWNTDRWGDEQEMSWLSDVL